MTLQTRRTLLLLTGFFAALTAWALTEILLIFQTVFPGQGLFILLQGGLVGLVFGGAWGAFDGTAVRHPRRRRAGLLRGGLLGILGGAAAFYLGQTLLLPLGQALLGGPSVPADITPAAAGVPADASPAAAALVRAAGWTVMGLVIGLIDGTRTFSPRRLLIGAAGGLAGGFLGGFLGELLQAFFPGRGIFRGAGIILFGLGLAFFYALFQRFLSYGVIRVLNGPLRGREFPLDQHRCRCGDAPRCEIPLPGYGLAGRSADLTARGGEIWLQPREDRIRVNQRKAEEGPLKWEDTLQMGRAKLIFRPLALLITAGLLLTAPAAGRLAAQDLNPSVTQVDTSRLLFRQETDLYLSVLDTDGRPVPGLGQEDFQLEERTAETEEWQAVPLLSVQEGINKEKGIAFSLMIDNSASMYWDMDGNETDRKEATRSAAAKRVLRRFLSQIDNPRDTAGLASFNTYYTVHAAPGTSPAGISGLLPEISEPAPREAYTELYASLERAAEDLSSEPGRRAVIVLSDGENFSYFARRGEDHPQWGDQEFHADEVIETFRRRGLTLYAVNLGNQQDPRLPGIAASTGGAVFEARSEEDLSQIYSSIRQRLLQEYRLRYRPRTATSPEKEVRVTVFQEDTAAGQDSRRYYSSSLLGDTPAAGLPVLLALLALGLAGLLFILARSWQEDLKESRLTVLDSTAGTVAQPRVPLGAQTVIGGRPEDGLTIAGDPGAAAHPAALLKDETTGAVTIAGAPGEAADRSTGKSLTEVTVNHQPAKPGQKLEAGDVLTVGGATILYEAPEDTDP